eukprot:g32347.t1
MTVFLQRLSAADQQRRPPRDLTIGCCHIPPQAAATIVRDFIGKCVEGCVPKKLNQMYPNWTPWMNQEIRSLLKSRFEAYKSGNPDIYRKS